MLSLGEANHPSPVSVLEAPYKEELSSSSECLGSVSTDISGKMTITASHYINQPLVQILSIFLFPFLWLGSWMQVSDNRYLRNSLRGS